MSNTHSIGLLLLVSSFFAANASNTLNPVAIGLRCALASRSNSFVSNTRSRRKNNAPTASFDWLETCSDFVDEEEEITSSRKSRRGMGIPNKSMIENVANTKASIKVKKSNPSRGIKLAAPPALTFHENMICGAVSRSIAQVCTHPANTMKTLLQSKRGSADPITIKSLAQGNNLKMLTRGAGAQFIMSIPHGAINFAVLDLVRNRMNNFAMKSAWASEKAETSQAFGPALDFLSSAVATICCSVISTPQMMVVDNIMAGTYSNFPNALIGLSKDKGIMGFYGGWWPGLVGKIPSYALTWTLFQQLKQAQLRVMDRPPKDIENSFMGCIASATTVCIMIPMDTIKTRLVTQMSYPDLVPYKGIIDCARRIAKEEGMKTFYRGLPPRLISVVPMIGIQFGVYEFMKRSMVSKRDGEFELRDPKKMEEIIMEVSADDEQPFPSPHIAERPTQEIKKRTRSTN